MNGAFQYCLNSVSYVPRDQRICWVKKSVRGGGTFTDGEHVRGVDGPPVLPAHRVLVTVQLEPGGHVLGDGVVQAADLADGRDAYDVVGADEHGGAVAVAGALDQRVEEELLGLGRLGDGALVVAVDLRSDDEGHVGVPEVTHHPFKEVGERDVVGVHGGEELVLGTVHRDPRVVVAVFGTGLVGALVAVPVRDAEPGEVLDAEFRAERLGLFVVALVQEPDVHGSCVGDPDGAFEGGADHGEGFLAGDVRGEEGDPCPFLGHDRYRVPGHHRGVRDADHVDDHEQLDQPDGYEHRDVEADQPACAAFALHPVARPHQVDEKHAGEDRREGHQQDGAYSVRLSREELGVLHLVRRAGRLRQRSGETAVGVVFVALGPHSALQ